MKLETKYGMLELTVAEFKELENIQNIELVVAQPKRKRGWPKGRPRKIKTKYKSWSKSAKKNIVKAWNEAGKLKPVNRIAKRKWLANKAGLEYNLLAKYIPRWQKE